MYTREKTSFLRRLTGGKFLETYHPTSGMDVFYYENFIFYDTSGDEKYNSFNLTNVDGCLIFYTTSNSLTEKYIDFWNIKLKMISDTAPILFVKNKCDLFNNDSGDLTVKNIIEISCKTDYGIDYIKGVLNLL